MYKKIIFLVIVFLCFSKVSVFAMEDNIIYANEYYKIEENSVVIPICIKNNTGFMGMKIEISSPNANIVSLSKGNIFNKGLFSKGKINKNKTSFLWTGTENLSGDGIIVYVGMQNIQKNTTLNITYSIPDTFNEEWKDVSLDIKEIQLGQCKLKEKTVKDDFTKDAIDECVNKVIMKKIGSEKYSSIVNGIKKKYNLEHFNDINAKNEEQIQRDFVKEFSDTEAKDIVETYKGSIDSIISKGTDVEEEMINSDKSGIKQSNVKSELILVGVIICIIFLVILFIKRGITYEKNKHNC